MCIISLLEGLETILLYLFDIFLRICLFWHNTTLSWLKKTFTNPFRSDTLLSRLVCAKTPKFWSVLVWHLLKVVRILMDYSMFGVLFFLSLNTFSTMSNLGSDFYFWLWLFSVCVLKFICSTFFFFFYLSKTITFNCLFLVFYSIIAFFVS